MFCTTARIEQFDAWIDLSREVEPLFGPMADVPAFRHQLVEAIGEGRAVSAEVDGSFVGGVVIEPEGNSIAWLAVSAACRGLGAGTALVRAAIDRLDPAREIVVQTFADDIPEGSVARSLYRRFGFTEGSDGGLTPAGIPTVFMIRPAAD